MGRFALIVAALALAILVSNSDLMDLEPLKEKFWLVAILPGVYMLGLGLLRD